MSRTSNNVTDEQFEQIIDWIWATRQGDENATWFLNSLKDNKGITETGRGYFDGDLWHPFEKEERACCGQYKPTDEEPYILIAHCQTREHVVKLIEGLNNKEIKRELNTMLKSIAATIAGIGENE
jgi:hypothetical protein